MRDRRGKEEGRGREGTFSHLLSPCPSGSRAAVPGGRLWQAQILPRRQRSAVGLMCCGGRGEPAREKPEVTHAPVPSARAGRGSSTRGLAWLAVRELGL